MKNRYLKENVLRLLNSKLFLLLSFVLIIMIFIQIYGQTDLDVFSSSINIFTNPLFLIVCYFPIFMFLTQYNFQLFDRDTFLIIRFKSKKKYLIELIRNIIITNSIVFVICLLILFTCENILVGLNYKVFNIEAFNTTNLIYMIFVFLRLYLITMLLSITMVLLLKKYNKVIVLLISFVFLGFLYVAGYNFYYINNISEFRFLISDILINNSQYDTFLSNIINTVIVIVFHVIINILLYSFVKNNMKEIGD